MTIRALTFIFIAALLTAGAFTVFARYAVTGPDSMQYDTLGSNLASGRGFSLSAEAPYSPTMFREPIYPLFLAFVYKVFGHSVAAVLAIQALLHAITAVLTYAIASEIFSKPIAALSGCAVAIFPTLANTAAYLLSETFFTFLLCLSVLTYLICLKKRSIPIFMVCGLLFGLLALTKAAAVLLPAVLIVTAFIIEIIEKRAINRMLICLLVFALISSLVPALWMVRNKVVFNTFSLTLRGGEALWSRAQKLNDSPEIVAATACYSLSERLGSNFFPSKAYRPERFLFKDFDRAKEARGVYEAQGLSDVQIDDIFRKEAMDMIRKRSLAYAAYTPIEAIKMTAFTYLPVLNEPSVAVYFSSLRSGRNILSGMKACARFIAYPLLILFIAGIVRQGRQWPGWLPIVAIVCYFNGIYALLDAIGRYAVPLIPLYCIMAAAAFFPPLIDEKQ